MNLTRRLKAFAMRFARTGGAWYRWAGRQAFKWDVDYHRSSVVMAPLQWMMRTFPEAPLCIDKLINGTWEQQDEHDLQALLERPNPYYSGDLLWRATVAEIALTGNAYWIKIQDSALRVGELWWVPSSLIEPRWAPEGNTFIDYYEYSPGGEKIKLRNDQVVHYRWDIDPENQRKGLSPLASVLREVFADDEAGRFAAALLKNMGVPGLIVSPDGDYAIGDDDMRAAKQAITEQFAGDNAGQPFIAGAPTKVEQFGFNPQQMDMRTLRKVPEERVSGVLGVAAIVCGLGAGLDRSTFANFKEAREASYEGAIIPLQRLLAAEVRHQLLPDFEPDLKQVRCRFDLDEVRALQEDQNSITTRLVQELQAGAITLDDYLRETGRESLPNKQGQIYLRSFNVVEVRVEDLGKPPEPAPAPPLAIPPPGQEQRQLPPGAEDAAKPKQLALFGKKQAGSDMQRRLNDAYMRSADQLAKGLAPRVETILDGLGLEASHAYASLKGRKEATDDAALQALAARILAAVDVARHAGKLKAVLEQHYAQVADNTLNTINAVLEMQVNLPDYKAREIIAQGGTRAGLVDLEATAKQSIYEALLDGRIAGEGPDELGRRIRSLVPAGPFPKAGAKYRSELIATTETHHAQRLSAIEAYKAAGAVSVLAFDAQGGGDTDLHCELRNGQVFSFDQVPDEEANSHPNCTLSWAPNFA